MRTLRTHLLFCPQVHTVDDVDFGWAVLLHVEQPQINPVRGQKMESTGSLVLHCLLEILPLSTMCDDDGTAGSDEGFFSLPLSMVEPAQSALDPPGLEYIEMDSDVRTVVRIVTVPLACVAELSSVCLKVRSALDDSTSSSGSHAGKSVDIVRRVARLSEPVRRHLWHGIQRARDQLGGYLPLLDPIKDMRISDPKLKQLAEVSSNAILISHESSQALHKLWPYSSPISESSIFVKTIIYDIG